MVEQAERAESDGFSSLWFASAVGGDPLVAMALAGRATSSIELGTSVLQTYTCHPVLQANRAASVAAGMGRAGFTLGLGPSHRPAIEDAYGLSYATPGAAHGGVRACARAPPPRGDRGAPRGRVRRRPRGSGVTAAPSCVADDLGPRAADAAGRRCAHRRHHPLDGQRARRRVPRGPAHRQGRGRRRSTRAAHRLRAPDRGRRRRGRGARCRRSRLRGVRRAAELPPRPRHRRRRRSRRCRHRR